MTLTPLEVRLIAYGLAFLLIVGGAGFVGYKLSSHHYQALMAADKVASDEAVLAQEQRVIAVQAAQQAASVAAEKQLEDAKATSVTLGDELTASLRNYAALRRSLMPAPSGASSGTHAAPSRAGGDQGIAGLAGQAATACLQDAAELTALQQWALSISKVTP